MTKLRGRVTVHGGAKPARTATVELIDDSGDVIDQVRVDDAGAFTYHLIGGSWKLNVWDAHGHTGRVDVSVQEGEEKVLEVDLEEPEGGHG